MDKTELMNVIYDTLFENRQHEQFNQLDIVDQFIDNADGTIQFDMTIEDTTYTMKLSIEQVGQRFFLDNED